MTLTPSTLRKALPGIKSEIAERFAAPLDAAMAEFDITTPDRVTMFLAQTAFESGNFARLTENLRYSAERLLIVFPKYFTKEKAHEYANQPEAIASRVYANRLGNGTEGSGDGWIYRGRGLIQLTGCDNYRACGDALGVDLVARPDAVAEPVMACRSAGWFWQSRGLNALADAGDFERITRKINGGTASLPERLAVLHQVREGLNHA